jgi:predicted heme/steroid binding protein
MAWDHHSFHHRGPVDHLSNSNLENVLYHEIRNFIECENNPVHDHGSLGLHRNLCHRKKAQPLLQKKDKLTPEELQHFDGKENKPAFFAYNGKVFDVSSSKLWKDGTHFKKHSAGNDLTDILKTAPHGEEKILQMPEVGKLLPIGTKVEKLAHEKVFYFMAYMNLIFVFLITFVIALWRWW